MLTGKQQRFVDEYLIDLNATQAAIRAGYSPKTAEQQGTRLFRNAQVQQAVSDGQRQRSERTKIDADWVLRRLADEAEADVADLYAEDGQLKPVREWPLIWRKGLVSGLDVEEVRDEGVVTGLIKKLKLSDRIRRIELIGKHVAVQAFREQVGLGGPNGDAIKIETNDIDVARRIAFALAKGAAATDGSK